LTTNAGLQVWDQNGNPVLDATYRVMRIINSISIGQSNASGSITNSLLAQGGWFSFQPSVMPGAGFLSGGMLMPIVSITGDTLTWGYPAVNNATYDTWQNGILLYGGS
jgi:hypothetical protein